MAYDAKMVANYFLDKAKSEGRTLTPMQLQKLVYFAHGWHLALFGQPLIREQIQAWSYGPVIPSLYQEFKRFGDQGIQDRGTSSEFIGTKFVLTRPSIDHIENPQEKQRLTEFLNRIWEVYAPYTAIQLSNLTHADDSPWTIAWNNANGARNTIIQNDSIQHYFELQRNNHAREAR